MAIINRNLNKLAGWELEKKQNAMIDSYFSQLYELKNEELAEYAAANERSTFLDLAIIMALLCGGGAALLSHLFLGELNFVIIVCTFIISAIVCGIIFFQFGQINTPKWIEKYSAYEHDRLFALVKAQIFNNIKTKETITDFSFEPKYEVLDKKFGIKVEVV